MVCTGNQCRSPMAEGLLRSRFQAAHLPVTVSSAGLLAGGAPATPTAVAVLRSRGIELDDHRSRQLTPELVGGADLVVGMAREHVRAAAVARPDSFHRTYTLKELVRRGNAVGPREREQSLEEWLLEVHEGRSPSDMLGLSDEDDIDDPIGEPRAVYEGTADEIAGLLDQLGYLVWGIPKEQSHDVA